MPYSIKKISNATATQAGLMSAADKRKLDAGLSFHPTRLPNAFALFFYGFGGYEDEPNVLTDDALPFLDGLTPALLHESLASGQRLRFGLDSVYDPDGTATEQQKLLASYPVKVDMCGEGEEVGGTEATVFFLTLDTPAIGGAILCARVYFAKDGGQLLKAEGFQAFRTLDKGQYEAATTVFSRSGRGLCPEAPASDPARKFLRGDGTWADPLAGVAATVKTFAKSAPMGYVEGGTAFDPFAVLPFAAEDALCVLRGYGTGKDGASCPVLGTLGYSVTGTGAARTVLCVLDINYGKDYKHLTATVTMTTSVAPNGQLGDNWTYAPVVWADPLAAAGDDSAGTALPETLKVLAPGELPWLAEGSADFDPTTLFPFSGKPERWVLQGRAPIYPGDTTGYPCTGTFEYGVDEAGGSVVAVLSYTAALSASVSVRRTRTGEITYGAGGGIDGISWHPFGWMKPQEA